MVAIPPSEPLTVVILATGGGTTARAVIESTESGSLKGRIRVGGVITNREKAGVTEKALARNIPVLIITSRSRSAQEFADLLIAGVKSFGGDIVAQLGWLPITPSPVIEKFENCIFNQHPASLDYPWIIHPGGKGMYGGAPICAWLLFLREVLRVHKKLLYPWIEVTTHRVTPEVDAGAVLRALPVEIPKSHLTRYKIAEAVAALQKRILKYEHQNVIETLQDFAFDRVTTRTRRKPLVPPEYVGLFEECKQEAIRLYPRG